MPKSKVVFVCRECKSEVVKWIGRCNSCKSWNSFEEKLLSTGVNTDVLRNNFSKKNHGAKKLSEVSTQLGIRIKTHINEFDRVMSGGLVKGSITLISGEPGVGKSTLLMEITDSLLQNKRINKALYVSGEESSSQVADRANRLNICNDALYIYNETSWSQIIEEIRTLKPDLFILDSIQTTTSQDVAGTAGSLVQVREVINELMKLAKASDLTCLVIGHTTKGGAIAGPKTLEHMVDTVIHLEGSTEVDNRVLRVLKNRFGSTNELGLFKMGQKGLTRNSSATCSFISNSDIEDAYGRAVSCVVEGSRSIIVEIQGLVIENKFSGGKKISSGIDNNRLSVLMAIIDKYFEVPVSYHDTYLNVAGGYKLGTSDGDLAILASLLSSFYKKSISKKTAFVGEVGLLGEVRCVPSMEKRIKELEIQNFKKIVLSKRSALKYSSSSAIELFGITKAVELKDIFFNN